MLAQYLASYSCSNQTSNLGSVTPGEGHREGLEWHSVRILINPSNSCYVNACILCLAWITLIMDALSPSFWPLGGFELFRNVTATCWAPLTMVTFQPFLWLVSQGWTVDALDTQHDVADFCHWLLQRLCPSHINCDWMARHLRWVHPSDVRDGTEKGSQHGLLQIPLFDPLLMHVTLQQLVNHWHDSQGVCRAADKVGYTLVIQISRYMDLMPKVLQTVEISETIRFPFFSQQDDSVIFHVMNVSGLVFHLGQTPDSGHYRAVLRYQNQWLAYEDAQPPERYPSLPKFVLDNVVLVFLTPSECDRHTAEQVLRAHATTNMQSSQQDPEIWTIE